MELVIRHSEGFRERCPEIAEALFDCTAFANRRYDSVGQPERICLVLE